MDTNSLKKFAKETRIKLLETVANKLDYLLTNDSAELRGKAVEIDQLKKDLQIKGKQQLIEEVSYIWFNRFMALRFMDANGYNTTLVVTPLPNNVMPEILQEAKAGNIDESLKLDKARLNDLLDGKIQAPNPQAEVYKMLLVASCNALHSVMPFMFERISDYTELLLPDDLLSDLSIIADIRKGMTNEDSQNEEILISSCPRTFSGESI